MRMSCDVRCAGVGWWWPRHPITVTITLNTNANDIVSIGTNINNILSQRGAKRTQSQKWVIGAHI